MLTTAAIAALSPQVRALVEEVAACDYRTRYTHCVKGEVRCYGDIDHLGKCDQCHGTGQQPTARAQVVTALVEAGWRLQGTKGVRWIEPLDPPFGGSPVSISIGDDVFRVWTHSDTATWTAPYADPEAMRTLRWLIGHVTGATASAGEQGGQRL